MHWSLGVWAQAVLDHVEAVKLIQEHLRNGVGYDQATNTMSVRYVREPLRVTYYPAKAAAIELIVISSAWGRGSTSTDDDTHALAKASAKPTGERTVTMAPTSSTVAPLAQASAGDAAGSNSGSATGGGGGGGGGDGGSGGGGGGGGGGGAAPAASTSTSSAMVSVVGGAATGGAASGAASATGSDEIAHGIAPLKASVDLPPTSNVDVSTSLSGAQAGGSVGGDGSPAAKSGAAAQPKKPTVEVEQMV